LGAVGVIGGMIIGSGMFALPYAVSISGLWGSIIGAAVAFFAVVSIHLAYGEVIVNTPGTHRLPGYTRLYLGKVLGNLEKVSQFLFFNAALLVYGVLGGIFLSTIFGGGAAFWAIVFFGAGSLILLVSNIERIGFVNFLLALPLIGATLWISFLAYRSGEISNLSFVGTDPFFAFGIFMFSLTGLAVIADAREIFSAKSVAPAGGQRSSLKSAILLGTAVPLILYVIFVTAVLMASGSGVTQDALSGLADTLGKQVVVFGAFIGILAMFTSYLALGYDLKEIYELDIGVGAVLSWVLVVLIPISLFLLGAKDFIKLISIIGGLFIVWDGLIVIFILRKMRRTVTEAVRFLSFGGLHQAILILIFIASIVYEVVYQIL